MTSIKPEPCISFHVGSISSLLFSLDTCLLSQYHTPHILFISLKEFNKGIYFTFFSVHQSAIYYSYKKWFPSVFTLDLIMTSSVTLHFMFSHLSYHHPC